MSGVGAASFKGAAMSTRSNRRPSILTAPSTSAGNQQSPSVPSVAVGSTFKTIPAVTSISNTNTTLSAAPLSSQGQQNQPIRLTIGGKNFVSQLTVTEISDWVQSF